MHILPDLMFQAPSPEPSTKGETRKMVGAVLLLVAFGAAMAAGAFWLGVVAS